MSYQIESIDVLTRRMPPPRIDFTIGKGQSVFPEWMRRNLEVRIWLTGERGQRAWGCAADWPSFLWLDKRPEVAAQRKLWDLLRMVQAAQEEYASRTVVSNPFEHWHQCYSAFWNRDQVKSAVPLAATFALALFERAVIDAFCRLHRRPFIEMLRDGRLGFDPGRIHAEVSGIDPRLLWPESPRTRIHLRHTIGSSDPLDNESSTPPTSLPDSLPQNLRQVIERTGITHFKIKVGGDLQADLARLEQIEQLILPGAQVVTLDGNESFQDARQLAEFYSALKSQRPQLFQRLEFVEQPLKRDHYHSPSESKVIRELSAIIPIIIDEADDRLDAFAQSIDLGYRGVSHKNCKGIFKSLANHVFCVHRGLSGTKLIMSAEDLTCMPVVSLQQDLAVDAALDLTHTERNAQHYFRGLDHLRPAERRSALKMYGDLYHRRGNQVRLNIQGGCIDISALNCPGLGVATQPDWKAMEPLSQWIDELRQDRSLDPSPDDHSSVPRKTR